jgi:acyl carrier protein phosphodiesterase
LESNKLLHEKHHKYAGVLTDVFYDYLLHQNWTTYSQQDFTLFKQQVYAILNKHLLVIPAHLQTRTSNMIAHDWLQSYTSENGMNYTFERMKTRTSKPEFLDDAFKSLSEHLVPLQAHFRAFFPDLINFVDYYTNP